MPKRRLIYIPDKQTDDSIVLAAKAAGLSVSGYLRNLHFENMARKPLGGMGGVGGDPAGFFNSQSEGK